MKVSFSVIISFFLLIATANLYGGNFRAEQGVLDLSERDLPLKPATLSGEWAFYWKHFITPQQQGKYPAPDTYGSVPSYWTSYDQDIPDITGFGYGSYLLQVILPPGTRDSLALSIPIFDTSYELFLNGVKVASNGVAGISKATTKPDYKPVLYNFKCSADTLDILIHVSNFNHRRGGFWLNMKLGDSNISSIKNEREKVINYSLLGILFGTVILFALFYFFSRSSLTFLFFALAAFGMMVRLGNTGNYPADNFIAHPWIWNVRLEYIGTFMAFVFGLLYLNEFYPSKIMGRFVRLIAYLFSGVGLMVLLFEPPLFSYSIFLLEALGAITLGYYVILSFKGALNGRMQEIVFFVSIMIFMLAAIHDSLVAQSATPINAEYLLPLAFLLFIIFQAMIAIRRWSADYREKVMMHAELEYINQNLESIISDRTKELKKSTSELEHLLQFRSQLFSIIAHDLKSPVASIAQVSDLLSKKINEGEHAELISEMQQLSYSTIDLLENLLYWGMSQTEKIRYNPSTTNIYHVLHEIHELFKAPIKAKNIEIQLKLDRELDAYCDPSLIRIILRNIVSNAVKFTGKNGHITIHAKMNQGIVTIEIADDGIGIEKENLTRILNENAESTPGTSAEKGTGLGLTVVNSLVRLNNGTLDIQSKPGRGTTVKFTLPGKP